MRQFVTNINVMNESQAGYSFWKPTRPLWKSLPMLDEKRRLQSEELVICPEQC